jgi:signal transduction histidine kinase
MATSRMVFILISVALALVAIALFFGTLLYLRSAHEEQRGIALKLLYREMSLSQDVASESILALQDTTVFENGKLLGFLYQLRSSISLDSSGADEQPGILEILETLDAELHRTVKASIAEAQKLARDAQWSLFGGEVENPVPVLEDLLSGTLKYTEELQSATETLHGSAQWQFLLALPLVFMCLLLVLTPSFLFPLWGLTQFIRHMFRKSWHHAKKREETAQFKIDNTVAVLVPIIYDRLMPHLHVISGILGIIATSKAPHPIQKLLSVAERSVAFLLRSVHYSTEYVLAEAELLEIATARFDLRACVEDCIGTLYHRAVAKGMRLSCHIGLECPTTIVSDERRLRQVLLKLIALGLEHTNSGKVEIWVSVESVHGSREAGRDADQLQQYTLKFEVLDTGCGMTQSLQHNLLDPTKLKERYGLGLRILLASKIAQLLGGQLEVFSTLQKGTVWSMTIRCPGASTLKELHPQFWNLESGVGDSLATRARSFLVLSLGLSLGSKQTLTRACALCGIGAIHASSFREVTKILSFRNPLGCVVIFGERILYLQSPDSMIDQIHQQCPNSQMAGYKVSFRKNQQVTTKKAGDWVVHPTPS